MPATPGKPRPQPLRSLSSHSYRLPDTDSPNRTRSNTVHTPTIASVPEARSFPQPLDEGFAQGSDVFATSDHDDNLLDVDAEQSSLQNLQTLEHLPIEIRSFTDR